MALVAYGNSDDDVTDEEVEDEVETAPTPPVTAVDDNNLFASLPEPQTTAFTIDEPELIVEPSAKELSMREKPPPVKSTASAEPKKKKIIQLPLMPLEDSDEEDEKKKQPIVFSSVEGSSNVFGNLPKPKYSSTKEIGRTLLPYVLTKKPEPQSTPTLPATLAPKTSQKPTAKPVRKENPKQAGSLLSADYGSEDEDDKDTSTVTDFFSLDNTAVDKQRVKMVHTNISLAPIVDSCLESGKKPVEMPTVESKCVPGGTTETYLDAADAPLNFRHSTAGAETENRSSLPATYNVMPTHTSCDYENDSESYGNSLGEYEMIQYPEVSSVNEATTNTSQYTMPSVGNKRKRGQEEIKVIEVNLADHLKDSSLELTKNLTVEQDMRSHSKKRNKDMPTSQQKRKHQITYLAHQAKERELELKNQWAENKFSKKQTQSKYGF